MCPDNVSAITKVASASSYIEPYTAMKGINGVIDYKNRWMSQQPLAWLEIDLGCPCLVTSYTCKFLGMAGWSANLNLKQFAFQYSNPNTSITPDTRYTYETITNNTSSTYTKAINPGIKTRKVRIAVNATGTISTLLSAGIVNFDVVARPLGTNNLLSNLTTDKGTLAPIFSSATGSYTVNATGTSISITPTAVDPNATITVNGVLVASGTASAQIPLQSGDTVIPIVVISEDTLTQKTYSITVKGAKALTGLTAKLNDGTAIALSPTFNSAVKEYTASVDFSDALFNIQNILVTPTADATTKIVCNGQIITSGNPITISNPAVGDNVLQIVASTQDDQNPTTYKLTINRKHSTYLKTITCVPGAITPSITKASGGSYVVKAGVSQSQCVVTLAAEDSQAYIDWTVDGAISTGQGSISKTIILAKTAKATTISVRTDGISASAYNLSIGK
jgi:hypothetical protein